MIWIDEHIFHFLGIALQAVGIITLFVSRIVKNRFRKVLTGIFLTSLVVIGLLVVISISSGSYDWPLMGATLGFMVVGSMLETQTEKNQLNYSSISEMAQF